MSTAKLMVSAFDGERQPLRDTNLLITLIDARNRQRFRDFRKGPSIPFNVQLEDGDNPFRVIAFADGWSQAGMHPVHLAANRWAAADLMLFRKNASLNFANARWTRLTAPLRDLFRDERAYGDTMENQPAGLATLLNVVTAAELAGLSNHLSEIVWARLKPDRFFAWAAPGIVSALESGPFTSSSTTRHPGATRSFKQTEFDFANLQLSLHENEADPSNARRLMVEFDMDYFKDVAAHGLLEVLPNRLTGGDTDPREVYRWRWMAGRLARKPDFAPPFVVA